MEKFLKFKEEIDLKDLQTSVSDQRVVVLRKSQTTDTIQVKIPEGMANKDIRRVFGPYKVDRIYNEFPYPIRKDSISKYIVLPLGKLVSRNIIIKD